MTWQEKAKEFGGADLLFLSEDGECVEFIVVGEPHLSVSKYQGRESKKVAAPVVTREGFRLFVMGLRLFRRLCKHEAEFTTRVFRVIRHGEREDPRTQYELVVIDDADWLRTFQEIAEKEYNEVVLAEALEQLEDTMKG